MTPPNQLPPRVTFGPFEVSTSSGELRKGGTRVRLPAQPFAILLVLLKAPGELVTREQFREQIWAEGTFVDFEHGLNAAINKLRKALSDSAENPRYIETVPGRGYRFVGILDTGNAVPDSIPTPPEPRQEPPPRRRSVGPWERFAWAAGALVCLGAGLRFHDAPAWLRFGTPTPVTANAGLATFQLNQLTRDAGLSHRPALSRDGKLLAYSSDVSPDGGMDLYVRQVAGGQPIRLTFDGAGNTWPDFSPDGSKVVFRSNREGGGIYEIPTFGGQSRLLVRGGSRPRFSPDGTNLAYWVGSETVAAAVPQNASVWVVSAAGGQPHRIAPHLTAARNPIWSPDGKMLLFVGYSSAKLYDDANLDWWLATVDGTDELRIGLRDAIIRAGLSIAPGNVPSPSCWSTNANMLLFSARSGDAQNLWEIGFSPQTGKVAGVPRRLTEGAGNEEDVSCSAGGALAFTSRESGSHIWFLPFDLNRGRPTGPSKRITDGPADRGYPSLDHDARMIAFASNQSGRTNIWKRDLVTGVESMVTGSAFLQRFPAISPSGAKIAFAANEQNGPRTVWMAATGSDPEKMCGGCLRPTDWSSDEKTILIFGGTPYQIDLLDVATHQQSVLLKHPTDHLLYGHFSPDNRWISFTVRTSPTRAHLAIAPLTASRPIPESAWITIADVSTEDWANWSPDARTLYFPSEWDGHRCLWGQRIDTGTHRPIGEPFAAWHFHGRESYGHCCQDGWSAAAGRIAIALKQDTGNIWLMSHPGTR
jgi:Tol biopolymer transport system component/DNA-binding winged helix-turn-helix (wHTH) protein